jgi:hypothetical protein
VAEVNDALVVPAEAIASGHVFKITGSHVTRVPVEVGIRGTDRVEIKSSLAAGDLIVSPPVAGLEDGDNVRPVRADQASE